MVIMLKAFHDVFMIIVYLYINFGIITIPLTGFIIYEISHHKKKKMQEEAYQDQLMWLEDASHVYNQCIDKINVIIENMNQQYFENEEDVGKTDRLLKRINEICTEILKLFDYLGKERVVEVEDMFIQKWADLLQKNIKELQECESKLWWISMNMLSEEQVKYKEQEERKKREQKNTYRNTYGNTNRNSYSTSSSGYGGSPMFADCKTKEEVMKKYKKYAKKYHPDSKTGSVEKFQKLQTIYEKELAKYQ